MTERMNAHSSSAQNTGTGNSVGSEGSEISEDENGPGAALTVTESQTKFMSDQTQYFEQVKQFLVSQQMTLKQNLELLNNKMSKESNSPPTCVNPNPHEPVELKSLDLNSIEIESGGDREESASGPRKANAKDERLLPMCPICGIEFEHNSLLSSLEDHVASHWNSELLEVSEEPG